MNTLLAPQRPSGIPDTLRLPRRPSRPSLVDRLALHVGLWLLIWSTRTPELARDRAQHSRVHQTHQARDSRERTYRRDEALLAPLR